MEIGRRIGPWLVDSLGFAAFLFLCSVPSSLRDVILLKPAEVFSEKFLILGASALVLGAVTGLGRTSI